MNQKTYFDKEQALLLDDSELFVVCGARITACSSREHAEKVKESEEQLASDMGMFFDVKIVERDDL
jgi:hypothetical protein